MTRIANPWVDGFRAAFEVLKEMSDLEIVAGGMLEGALDAHITSTNDAPEYTEAFERGWQSAIRMELALVRTGTRGLPE